MTTSLLVLQARVNLERARADAQLARADAERARTARVVAEALKANPTALMNALSTLNMCVTKEVKSPPNEDDVSKGELGPASEDEDDDTDGSEVTVPVLRRGTVRVW